MAARSNAALPASSYLHRGISRLQAEKLLMSTKQDGSYLIRESETVSGAYTLCLLFEGRVHQYRIYPDSEGMLSVQSEAGVKSRKFSDLTQLINQYVQRGVKNGLVGPLTHPVLVDDVDEDLDDDEGERVEEADSTNLAYEIIPPSEDRIPYSENESSDAHAPFGEFVACHLIQRFSHLNLSGCDGPFINSLKHYIENDAAKDAATASADGTDMKWLKIVLADAARELDRQVENFMLKIDVCRQLFGPITTAPLVKTDKNHTMEKLDLNEIFERMSKCKGAVKNLERKAELKYRDLSSMWKDGNVVVVEEPSISRGQPAKPIIPPVSFEAKVIALSQAKKIKLTVDIQNGKLLAIKPTKDVMNDRNVFTHDKIEQLIKSPSNKCRLDIKIAGLKKKAYVFEDVRHRENFCQLVQQLKNMHSMNADIRQISVYVGTWNMAGEIPNYNLAPWLKSDGLGKKRNSTMSMLPHDIYVVGTQESCMSEKDWGNKLKAILYDNFVEDFHLVATSSLWGTRVVVLVRQQHRNKISHVQVSSVKTGIANALGNKGAVGVSFMFDGTSFCFISCHLTSGHENLARRNRNARYILKGLNLGPKNSGFYDTSNHFHHLFFFGDLNYRLDELDSLDIIQRVKNSTDYSGLMEYDQLKKAQMRKEAFVGFEEEEITFPPTYRFQKLTRDRYVWEKFKTTGKRINAPSWCDRILWRSYPETDIFNTSYGCVDTICSSDHKPVFSSFNVGIINQFTASKGGSALSGDVKIIFEDISAAVKSTKQENMQVHLYSPCLENPVISKQNCQFGNRKEGYCCPVWSAGQLLQLQPIFDDWDYLEDQHLLLSVKTADDVESYGECVLSLKFALSVIPQPFESMLTHLGEETGSVRGHLHIQTGDVAALDNRKPRKAHDFIYVDTDFGESSSNQPVSYDQGQIYAECSEWRGISAPPAMVSRAKSPLPAAASDGPAAVSNASIDDMYSRPIPHEPASDPGLMRRRSSSVKGERHSGRRHRAEITRAVSNCVDHAPLEDSVPAVPPRKNRPVSTKPAAAAPLELLAVAGGDSGKPAPPVPRSRPAVIPQKNASFAAAGGKPTVSPGFSGNNGSSVDQSHWPSENDVRANENAPKNLHRANPLINLAGDNSDDDESNDQYTVVRSPISVEEWLENICLSQYLAHFIDGGWDQVQFLGDMTVGDLIEIGVTNADHQSRILHSINSSLRSIISGGEK